MTKDTKGHCIPDPFPESIGITALTIWAPADFRGDLEINWWYPGKDRDEDKQILKCNATWLLQGVFHDVRGKVPSAQFAARVVALVLHTFYRARIESAARLEAAYQWRLYER